MGSLGFLQSEHSHISAAINIKSTQTQINENTSASKYECHHMQCFVLCALCVCVCTCVRACACYPCPKEGRGCCENQCSSKWALRRNPPQRLKEQLKVTGCVQQSTTVSPSISRGLCTELEAWLGGVPTHNFPWVMNCEMQQKPPLLQEGFRAHRAIEEKMG